MVKIKDKVKENDVKAIQGKVIYLKEGVSFNKYNDEDEEVIEETEIISLDDLDSDIIDEDFY